MEPNTTIDYYGQKEYTGPDAYAHFNDSLKNSHLSPAREADIIQPSHMDLYGTSPPHEYDWYANNQPNIISSVDTDNSTFVFYLTIKRRAYWYIWKIHSTEYNSYKNFKQAWNPKNSVRKEIFNDIKKAFFKKR